MTKLTEITHAAFWHLRTCAECGGTAEETDEVCPECGEEALWDSAKLSRLLTAIEVEEEGE